LDGLGLRVPDDVLLAGFDDTSTARVMTPQLTTIRQPCDLIAETAFDRLLRRLVNPALPPAEILLPAPLVARASTRRPEGAAARTQSQKKSKTKQQKKKGKK
jgi:LacI family transcriptional regulator